MDETSRHVTAMWVEAPDRADLHVAMRGVFELAGEDEVEIRLVGASWFAASLDGQRLCDGTPRFEVGRPEYVPVRRQPGAGRHVLAVHLLHEGVDTKRQEKMPPFLWAKLLSGGREIAVRWRAMVLDGYQSQVRRINHDLGWIDWCNTGRNPAGWEDAGYDDAVWPEPKAVSIAEPAASDLHALHMRQWALRPMAEGVLSEQFGYDLNDPPVRFFLRDLQGEAAPAQGLWRRYDLGRVRLGRPSFELDLPKGTGVEFAYAEALRSGRVGPWITLSNGASCNFDHFVARGGRQVFEPLTPKGGRFVEVHVLPSRGEALEGARFIGERYIERGYHGEPRGTFECDDDLLNRIWAMGVDTYRACAEDAVIDNPTRERGQWTGDALVGLESAAVAYGDLSLIRHMLVQAGRTTRPRGMVQCLSPARVGGVIPSFAAMWVTAVVRLHRYTADMALLRECYDDVVRNLAAFEEYLSPEGLAPEPAGWSFVDWGYARPEGTIDLAVNLHYVTALRNMCAWCVMLGRDSERYYLQLSQVVDAVRKELSRRLDLGGWDRVGYHAAALALAAHLLEPEQEPGAIQYIKRHLLACFPNNPGGERLSDPSVSSRHVMTPFFAHFAFPGLIERNEMDFVLAQYRRCWGWMLNEVGATTCLEVFDPRWSHCHQWSACPTWQMTRYVLGLHPRYDRGPQHVELNLWPGSLRHAHGTLPLGDGDVQVRWRREGEGIEYELQTQQPIQLHRWNRPEAREVHGRCRIKLEWSQGAWRPAPGGWADSASFP